eukprot:11774780-Ditylum_brightwellii.AAC.1
MAGFTEMIASDYVAKKKPTTARNSQGNSIIERVHHAIENMIRSFDVHDTIIDEKDSWMRMFRAVRFVIRAIEYITMNATPMQSAFGRDATLIVRHKARWKYINERREKMDKKIMSKRRKN